MQANRDHVREQIFSYFTKAAESLAKFKDQSEKQTETTRRNAYRQAAEMTEKGTQLCLSLINNVAYSAQTNGAIVSVVLELKTAVMVELIFILIKEDKKIEASRLLCIISPLLKLNELDPYMLTLFVHALAFDISCNYARVPDFDATNIGIILDNIESLSSSNRAATLIMMLSNKSGLHYAVGDNFHRVSIITALEKIHREDRTLTVPPNVYPVFREQYQAFKGDFKNYCYEFAAKMLLICNSERPGMSEGNRCISNKDL